jgi:hypothetical protein
MPSCTVGWRRVVAKFIMGALVGLTIGMLAGSYFANNSLEDFMRMARTGVSRFVPTSN